MINNKVSWVGFKKNNLYNEEFDPGSGWTLATGLTHASRGAAGFSNRLPATGARVSNGYATYPVLENNPLKDGLTLHSIGDSHEFPLKCKDTGWACFPLVCWWGNGSPRLRWIGVLRGRSPTLVLRHGPDSYGRQQWGILVNGRETEPAMSRAGLQPYGF